MSPVFEEGFFLIQLLKNHFRFLASSKEGSVVKAIPSPPLPFREAKSDYCIPVKFPSLVNTTRGRYVW